MRLIDRLWYPSARLSNEYDASGASVFYTTFGAPDNEKILPGLAAYNERAYQNNGIVFAVILARLMLFSEAEFKWQNLKDKNLFGTPELSLLEHPWPNGTTGEMLARMEQDASLAGNAFIRKVDSRRLVRLRPDWVTIVAEVHGDSVSGHPSYRSVMGYDYDPPVNSGEYPGYFPVEEVAHWSPIPDPCAQFKGMSWLTPVIREIQADTGLTEYKDKYTTNAATPNLLVKYTQKIGAEKALKIAQQVQARHGGVSNAFKTLVLDEGADVTVIGNSLEQMNFTSVQAAGENRIAVAAGVPGIVAGLKEGLAAATYSNYEQAMRRFADLTMRPLWRSACAALEPLVAPPPEGSRLWFDANSIAALRQGEKERAATFKVKADTAGLLIRSGYEPDSVAAAVAAGDLSLLTHTGSIPVTLYQGGLDPSAGGA